MARGFCAGDVSYAVDLHLIQQVEELSSGETAHLAANLLGAYRTACREYENSGDPDYLETVHEAERALRSLLYQLRRQRAGLGLQEETCLPVPEWFIPAVPPLLMAPENTTDASAVKPTAYKAVRIWLRDGTRMHGMWTGSTWWSVKGEVSPVRWELEERPKKTKKISKVLPSELG